MLTKLDWKDVKHDKNEQQSILHKVRWGRLD
jgi:hypothetical protein